MEMTIRQKIFVVVAISVFAVPYCGEPGLYTAKSHCK